MAIPFTVVGMIADRLLRYKAGDDYGTTTTASVDRKSSF